MLLAGIRSGVPGNYIVVTNSVIRPLGDEVGLLVSLNG